MDNTIRIASGEGARGAGKTSTINKIIEQSTEPITVNRVGAGLSREGITVIDTHKSTSPFHKRALEIHAQWTEAVASPGEKAEELSWKKFELGLLQLRYEADSYSKAIAKSELTLLDRDLDTAVVYAAAEIILSNPAEYDGTRGQIVLLSDLWHKVSNICQSNNWCEEQFPHLSGETDVLALVPALQELPFREIPPNTFYFFTKDKEGSLRRSQQIREGTTLEYALSDIQQATQDIIQPLYLYSFLIRRRIFPESDVHYFSSDAHNIEEMAKLLTLHLDTKPFIIPGADDIPLLLRHDIKTLPQLPANVEELARIVFDSTVGSAFPSKWEVRQNGESNCVFSNSALAQYSKLLGLGDVELMQVQQENYSHTCPVHWTCIQWINREQLLGRVVDVTPFRKATYVSPVVHFNKQEDCVQVVNPPLGFEFTVFKSDDRHLPEDAMQFAFDVEYTFTPDAIDALIKQGYELLGQCTDEALEVFMTIRLGRLLQKACLSTEAVDLLRTSCEKIGNNLILGREVAKYVQSGLVTKRNPEFLDYLIHSEEILASAIDEMRKDPTVAPERIEDYYEYRKLIPEMLSLLRK